jgi:hypothetical protein
MHLLNLDGKLHVWIELIEEIESGEELTVAAWTCQFFGQQEGNTLPFHYQHINGMKLYISHSRNLTFHFSINENVLCLTSLCFSLLSSLYILFFIYSELRYDPHLSEEMIDSLQRINTLEDWVEIRIIDDPSHP